MKETRFSLATTVAAGEHHIDTQFCRVTAMAADQGSPIHSTTLKLHSEHTSSNIKTLKSEAGKHLMHTQFVPYMKIKSNVILIITITYLGGEAGLYSCQHIIDEFRLESLSTHQAIPHSFPTAIRMRFYMEAVREKNMTR